MKLRLLALLSLAALATASVLAQQATDFQAMAEARDFRSGLAAYIAAGRVEPAAALAKLKSRRAFFGANVDADSDQAQAAADLGQRLLNSATPEKANVFFRAAEISLGLAINHATDPAIKARLLVDRAQIRSQRLDKKVEAAADVNLAAQLLPDDKYVQSWRQLLRLRDAQALQIQTQH